jgi:hypothetical protein
MTKSIRLLALVAVCLLSWLRASAQTASETRNLSSFNQVDIAGGFEAVTLQEGATESVAIEASGIELDKIKTEVKGNTLQIGLKNGQYKNSKIRVTVTYRSLKEINNSGSSDVVAKSPFKGDEFQYHSSGSGDFTGSFDVKKLDIAISGSSDMTLSGQAEQQQYAISGSGDIKAGQLSGRQAEVAISGSGDVELNVSGPVQTAVSGSGKVINKQK